MLGDMTVSQRHTRKRNLGSERLALFGDSEAVLIELALVCLLYTSDAADE